MNQSEKLIDSIHQAQMGTSEAKSGPVDSIAQTELILFIDNDGDLYRQQFMPIIENIKRRIKKGRYDHALAPKLWGYLMDNGGKKYVKEVGGDSKGTVDTIFNKNTRMAAAREMADRELEKLLDGEYGDIVIGKGNKGPGFKK